MTSKVMVAELKGDREVVLAAEAGAERQQFLDRRRQRPVVRGGGGGDDDREVVLDRRNRSRLRRRCATPEDGDGFVMRWRDGSEGRPD